MNGSRGVERPLLGRGGHDTTPGPTGFHRRLTFNKTQFRSQSRRFTNILLSLSSMWPFYWVKYTVL